MYLCKAGHTVPVAAQQVVGTTVAHGAVDIGIEVFDAAEHSAAFPQLKKEIGDDVFGRLLLVQIHACKLEKPVVIVQVELLECLFVPFGDLPENVVERYLCTFFCHGSALRSHKGNYKFNYFIPVRKFFTDVGFRLHPHIVFSGIPAAAFFHRQNPGL